MSEKPSRLTGDEARSIWGLAVLAGGTDSRLRRADALHTLRGILSAHAPDWQAISKKETTDD